MFKNTADQRVTLFVFEAATGLPATGKAFELTCYLSIDDAAYDQLADQTATEDDANLAAGYYTWNLTQAESDGDKLKFSGRCTTEGFVVVPDTIYTDAAPEEEDSDGGSSPGSGPTTPPPGEDDFVVRAGISSMDGCPILTRIKAFIVQEGTTPVLEYSFRDRRGTPIVLVEASSDESESESAGGAGDIIILRTQEFSGSCSEILRFEGRITDATSGTVRVTLNDTLTSKPGIYTLSWGLFRDDLLVTSNEGLLSVERTLFTLDPSRGTGPPTINELRMQLMDSAQAENQYLLDDLEFGDEQIMLALTKPLQYFNETNPPLGYTFNSQNFPYKSHWLDAAAGYLYQFAAAHYRRNRLGGQAGGQTIDDKNKEVEYLRISQLHLNDWKSFVSRKKLELNMAQVSGSVGSTYGRIG